MVIIIGGFLVWENNQNIEISKIEQAEIQEQEQNKEEKIEQAFYEKFPEWKHNIKNIIVEKNEGAYSIGKMMRGEDGYFWFAFREEDKWVIVDYGFSYNGICENFSKYGFPNDMIPDCWDTESKKLVETNNPVFFYGDYFSVIDKNNIIDEFKLFIKNKSLADYDRFYKNKDLYLVVYKNVENYFKGSIIIGGADNHSNPYILAVKINGDWRVVFQSQDYPDCNVVEKYKFPVSIVNKCFESEGGKIFEKMR